MLASPSRNRGVSLIELAVGITIIAILMATGLPSFSVFIQNSRIRTVAESIQNGLQRARAEALQTNSTVRFQLNNFANSAITEGSSSVQVAGTAGGTAITTLDFNGLGRVTPLPSGAIVVRVTNPAGGACVRTGPMRCLNITVTSGGQIHMCDPDPNLPSNDPRAC